ncbi:MAG: hypothetical protein KIT63_13450 [Rhodoferax sp.]|nr:hypothetical protein [Rhodoferax sp.]
MATDNVNQTADSEVADLFRPEIDETRRMVMLQATWELTALAGTLPDVVAFTDSQEHLVVRGIAARVRDLAEAVMAGLGDGGVPTRDIERKVMLRASEEMPHV